MKASNLFKEIGFRREGNPRSITYRWKTDYDELCIDFDLEMKRYSTTSARFIDRTDVAFVSMKGRPELTKHSARYGHWVSDNCIFVNMKIHNAIHKQLLELGWIENENNR